MKSGEGFVEVIFGRVVSLMDRFRRFDPVDHQSIP